MNVRIPALLVALIASALPAPAGVPQAGSRSSFVLAAHEPGHWSLNYTPGSFAAEYVTINGQRHISFGGNASAGMAAAGDPQLPVEILTLGLPFGSQVEAALVDPVYEDADNQLVAPCATYELGEKHDAAPLFQKNAAAYAQDRFLPARQVVVDTPFLIRHQWACAVRIAPYLYNPVSHTLRRLVRARLDVRITGTPEATSGNENADDPWFEDVYRNLLWNYQEAKGWRRGEPTTASVQSDPAGPWFKTGQPYFKISVAQDGWYSIRMKDLFPEGPPLPDLTTLQMIRRGTEVPLVVRADSAIEFYGLRNAGDTTYQDFYTDTSAYWLTWSNSAGLRYQSGTSLPKTGFPLLAAFATKHVEENTDYYEGTGESEITQNGDVPGEGWVWDYYYPGTSLEHPFTLDSIDAGASSQSSVLVRLYSTTYHSYSPDHRAQIWVNDSLAGEIDFNGRAEAKIRLSFPTAWLRPGANTLRVASLSTATTVNQFYLDWFEISYPRTLRAVNDQLTFDVRASSPGSTVECRVQGFSSGAIEVFDLTGQRVIGTASVEGDSVSGFAVTFADTVSTARRFVVVGRNGGLRVPHPVRKVFADIRENSTGADYIIITHRDFLNEAKRLAAERHAFYGVRTAVVDVEDIYDEFNDGVVNADALKRFVQYAFNAWPRPAPACLLLFGDASWDFHRYMTSTTKTDYVPAYGVPAGDNWYGCFDSMHTSLPSLLIGRLCVNDPSQASAVVDKIIGYDRAPVGDWNKNFMFITGGNGAFEQEDFNATTENLIHSYVDPAPVGGAALRVYKASPSVIDGEHKDEMRGLIKNGVSFLNFLGHSGGRTWGVDIGSPGELENTDGQLPFVSSVSCNVGAFAEPSNNVLSEDFVLAANRGAIAAWSSSSLGYAYAGSMMVGYFLEALAQDSLRGLGALTTVARYKLWLTTGSNAISLAQLNCTPLQGDPMSHFALPVSPDLAVASDDMTLFMPRAEGRDSLAKVRVKLHNYGLVPPDSVAVSMTDVYQGDQSVKFLGNIPPLYRMDSLFVMWNPAVQPGRHSLVVALDPEMRIADANRLNNIATAEQYLYASTLASLKPLNNAEVPAGNQKLIVSLPGEGGKPSISVVFEVDTVVTFDSPFKLMSGAVQPGPVSAFWTTPPLPGGRTFYWRARTIEGDGLGTWVLSAFTTSSTVPAGAIVRWHERQSGQFGAEERSHTVETDSGVIIAPRTPLQLWARSYGDRGGIAHHNYSRLGINSQTVYGYEWEVGVSFMGMRVSQFDGSYVFKAFDVQRFPAQADSLRDFINSASDGNYILLSVIFDGHTNVTETLLQVIESLGSADIRQVQPGQSWAFIGRKGHPGDARESLTNDSAVVSLQIPNYFSYGSGTIVTSAFPRPYRWNTFHWRGTFRAGVTDISVSLLGVRAGGQVDTLRSFGHDSIDVDLSFLNASGPQYQAFRFLATLSTSDALQTPVLKEWWTDIELPPDLALSTQSISATPMAVNRGDEFTLPVTVYNLGFRIVDSARVLVSVYDPSNMAHFMASCRVDSIAVDAFRSVGIPVKTQDLPKQAALLVHVEPCNGASDLVAENNSADCRVQVSGGSSARMQLFADGTQLMDGDYVGASPKFVIRIAEADGQAPAQRAVSAFVDGKDVLDNQSGAYVLRPAAGPPGSDLSFTPLLQAGRHEVRVVARVRNALGFLDSLDHRVTVTVADEYRILQMYNYPNPFASETFITFVLAGARAPEGATVRIFTVAGRKIRQLDIPASSIGIGFNKIPWDGRDNDGDDVANGYYFYQVQVSAGSKTETAIGKMVRMR